MKTILLMRHGKSSWKDKDLADIKRPLKKRGEEDAEFIGKLLKQKKLTPDLIASSPAKRAKQTAEIVAKKSNYADKIEFVDAFYMAEPSLLYKHLCSLNDKIKSVLIVGHNPGLEALMQLLDGKLDALPTGALAYIKADIQHWNDLNENTPSELVAFWENPREEEKEKDNKDKKSK